MIESLRAGLTAFFAFVPQLIGAIVVLIVGYIVAKILQAVVSRVLQSIGFYSWMEKGGIKQFFDRAQTTHTPLRHHHLCGLCGDYGARDSRAVDGTDVSYHLGGGSSGCGHSVWVWLTGCSARHSREGLPAPW